MLQMPPSFTLVFMAVGFLLCSLLWLISVIMEASREKKSTYEELRRLCALLSALIDCGVKLEDVPLLQRYLIDGAKVLDQREEDEEKDEEIEEDEGED